MNPQYDAALLGILQNEGKLENFMDVIFGFLMRRTDFFYERVESSTLGFAPDVARQIVFDRFDKYEEIFRNYQEKHLKALASKKELEEKETAESADSEKKTDSTGIDQDASEKTNGVEKKRPLVRKKETDDGPATYSSISKTGDRFYIAEPDCYNGARRDLYSWSQSITEIEIRVKIPETVQSGKEISVKIDRKHIRIDIKGATEPLIDLDLVREIHKEEALWSADFSEGHIIITLEKSTELFWDAAFVGEEKINVQDIDASRPMHELSDEAQAKIAQMLFDQDQKRQGLPTTEEKNLIDAFGPDWNRPKNPQPGNREPQHP